MKILFVSKCEYRNYLEDCLFHGLVTSGHDVVDTTYMYWMSPLTKEQKAKQYGRGFTLTDLLPDRSAIDRTDIDTRIKDREFDVVVYGNGTLRGGTLLHFDVVQRSYPKSKIAICDGGDETILESSLLSCGICFKRELVNDTRFVPISYAIPEEKIIHTPNINGKKKVVATVIPGNSSTYVFTEEQDYYNDYADSMFGITCKKGGWDCMRHYEIAANACVPYFPEYDKKPSLTMHTWPTELQLKANRMYEKRDFAAYHEICREFYSYCKENLTTKKLAEYVLGKLG